MSYLLRCPNCLEPLMKRPDREVGFCPKCDFEITKEELLERSFHNKKGK